MCTATGFAAGCIDNDMFLPRIKAKIDGKSEDDNNSEANEDVWHDRIEMVGITI